MADQGVCKEMASESINANSVFHPLAMNRFRHWRRALAAGGPIDRRQWLRAWIINGCSPLWAPLRQLESCRYGRAVRDTIIDEAPLFVLGHWRTGTTHLHNLFCQDPRFGYVTTFQTLAPEMFLVGRRSLRPIIARAMPAKRPMDNMALGPDLPQEEEFALCNLTLHTFYLALYFPKLMPEYFRKYVLFEGVSDSEREAWAATYLEVLRKATLHGDGRPLALKNPANTGRIPELLRLFPKARFVHIHRNPYRVVPSTIHLFRSIVDTIGFQHLEDGEIEENVLHFHDEMTRKYLRDRGMVPRGQLAEVAFDDLARAPVATVGAVYGQLEIEGWKDAEVPIAAYAARHANYERNRFELSPRLRERIREHCSAAIDAWGYEAP